MTSYPGFLLGLRGGGPLDLLTESIANHGSRSPGEPHGGSSDNDPA